MNFYTIGKISQLTGLSTKTIRFYEETEVISKAQRGENGYRLYQESNLRELKLIKAARDLGLPITEIKQLMTGCHDGRCHHSQETVNHKLENYIDLLTSQINQLTQLKIKFTYLKNHLDCPGPYCCDLLHQLLSLQSEGGDFNA